MEDALDEALRFAARYRGGVHPPVRPSGRRGRPGHARLRDHRAVPGRADGRRPRRRRRAGGGGHGGGAVPRPERARRRRAGGGGAGADRLGGGRRSRCRWSGGPTMADGIAVQRPGDIPFGILAASGDRVRHRVGGGARPRPAALPGTRQAGGRAGRRGRGGGAASRTPATSSRRSWWCSPAATSTRCCCPSCCGTGCPPPVGSSASAAASPTTLARSPGCSSLLAGLGANVLEVSHERLAPSLRVDEVEVVLQVETGARSTASTSRRRSGAPGTTWYSARSLLARRPLGRWRTRGRSRGAPAGSARRAARRRARPLVRPS